MKKDYIFDINNNKIVLCNFFDRIRAGGYAGQKSLYKEIAASLKKIRQSYKAALQKRSIGTVNEWLSDNYYIIEREAKSILSELKSLILPTDKTTKKAVIFLIIQKLCEITSGKLDSKTLNSYLDFIDTHYTLNTSELDSLLIMTKAGLLLNCKKAVSGNIEDEKNIALISNSIISLNNIASIDFEEIIEEHSAVEKILINDPANLYSRMDEDSRKYYRTRVFELSRDLSMTETEVAKLAIRLADNGEDEKQRHVGYYLHSTRLGRPNKKHTGYLYIIINIILSLGFSLSVGIIFNSIVIGLIAFPLVWEIFRPFTESIAMSETEKRFLPKLKFEGVIPDEYKTCIVVSTLLPSAAKAKQLKTRCEKLYLTNGRGNVKICILADLRESRYPEMPEDCSSINAAKRVIKELNKSYGNRFILIVRQRVFSKTQSSYSGWERKRGAITELIRLIKGEAIRLAGHEGDLTELRGTKYIMALDADTGLLMDSVAEMVSVAAHPLNTAKINEGKKRVESGYGIISPRICVDVESSSKTLFSRIMSGGGGITTYDPSTPDYYFDIFDEGIFTGKGLIDVEVFYSYLDQLFVEGKVLSHDILEGSFLRVAFLSDVEVTDSFPSTYKNFYERLHRWIRGDWQNSGWIFPRVKTLQGKIKNPLSFISRYKIFDNLRRSLIPIISLAAIILSLFLSTEASLFVCFIVLMANILPFAVSSLRAITNSGLRSISGKYYSGIMPMALTSLAQAFISIIFLSYNAVKNSDAIIRALWRSLVSKKNLLEWTTAADSEAKKNTAYSYFRDFYPSIIIGLGIYIYAVNSVQKLFGLLFMLATFPGIVLSKDKKENIIYISEKSRAKLLSYAAASWDFYSNFCNKTDSYLPPDNIQEAPVYEIAHRTSPTNIGLYLLSILAARDMAFIDSCEMTERIKLALKSIDKLEKWNGNLLNWYDTKKLTPLFPRFVSTIDSGNFACCLITLKEGLKEYSGENKEIPELINRLSIIIDETDLTPLYNQRRKLFHIGFDLEKNRLSEHFYDLFMSEARITSYFAIAKHQIQKKHWGFLGRTLIQDKGFTGVVSWTGTMFEYFMPYLLMPCYKGTLTYEALKFCILCQKERTAPKGLPWGISESGFYAFDAALNYQYKAHGVQKLGLKRALNSELVISPYSSAITLPFEPSAVDNLIRLENMGMMGRFGFYEAVDFTSSRLSGSKLCIVKSYMAHHVGMTMVALCNALTNNRMQKRFMNDKSMLSAHELLEEKIPSGAVVYENVVRKEIPERQGRSSGTKEEYTDIFLTNPRSYILSNGEWTSVVTDIGSSIILYRGIDIIQRSEDILRRPQGIFALINIGDKTYSLNKVLLPNHGRHRIEFDKRHTAYYVKNKKFEAGMMATVHPTYASEQRHFIIKNQTQKQLNTQLLIYFEPSLTKYEDEISHPAFSKLFISFEYDPGSKSLIFYRKNPAKQDDVYISAGFLEEIEFEYETSREKLLETPDGVFSLEQAFSKKFTKSTGIPDICGAVKLNIRLSPKSQKSLTFVITAGWSKSEVISRLIAIRREGALTPQTAAISPLGNYSLAERLAASVLSKLFFPVFDSRESLEAKRLNKLQRTSLWGLSISGDLPIVLVELESSTDKARIEEYIRVHRILSRVGIRFDLVFTYRDGGDYNQPTLSVIREICNLLGIYYAIGVNGGIHPVDLVRYGQETLTLLRAASRHIAPLSLTKIQPLLKDYRPQKIEPSIPVDLEKIYKPDYRITGGYFDSQSGFVISNKRTDNPWSHILANEIFGTLISDHSIGYTYAINSRENKLTPWFNDIKTENRGEMLILRSQDRYIDLINGASVRYSKSKAEFFALADDILSKATISISDKKAQKYIDLELINTGNQQKSFSIAYYAEVTLDVDRRSARMIASEWENNTLIFHNSWNSSVFGYMGMSCDSKIDSFTCDRPSFFAGEWDTDLLAPRPDPCGAVIKKIVLNPDESCKLRFFLNFAATKQAVARLLCEADDNRKSILENKIQINTPDKALNHMVNFWLPNQILSSRILARTAFYQSGGAYGFRDQLQDVNCLMTLAPKVTRRHIIRASSKQFEQGDVLHWWHSLPKKDGASMIKGVRTRYTDDLLWLPYTLCEYIEKTGDLSLAWVETYYLDGEPLKDNEHERYFIPSISNLKESVFDHCVRAIEHSLRFGERGIPLIRGGDWNDGFNLVGIEDRGESVWLGMFLIIVLTKFIKLCRLVEREDLAEKYLETADRLRVNIDENCYENGYYTRAYFDDGSPIGSKLSKECRIDILPQSFSVLCKMPDTERRNSALDNAFKYLVDNEYGIVKLFTPPFENTEANPGYIKSYPPGIRENGGQYTHSAVWFALSLLQEGRIDDGYRILSMLNPAYRYTDKEYAGRYLLEPYYIAADIYTNKACYGRGGWSIYTGAAGWYYKTVTEELIGLKLQGKKLIISPKIPSGWQEFSAELVISDTKIKLKVKRAEENEAKTRHTIVILDKKEHNIEIIY